MRVAEEIILKKTKEVNHMELHWDAAADLEDLIYECKEVSASER